MGNIDLTSAAADAASGSEPKTVTVGDKTFRLADEIDMLALGESLDDLLNVEAAIDSDDPGLNVRAFAAIGKFLGSVFADGEWERFRAEVRPGPAVIGALARQLPTLYGFERLGESSASPSPSAITGDGSKPTSSVTTGSTPGEPSSEAAMAAV